MRCDDYGNFRFRFVSPFFTVLSFVPLRRVLARDLGFGFLFLLFLLFGLPSSYLTYHRVSSVEGGRMSGVGGIVRVFFGVKLDFRAELCASFKINIFV